MNPGKMPRRCIDLIGESFDEVAPEELVEAEDELKALGLDPSEVGGRLERKALKALRQRILHDHSNAARTIEIARSGLNLPDKLN